MMLMLMTKRTKRKKKVVRTKPAKPNVMGERHSIAARRPPRSPLNPTPSKAGLARNSCANSKLDLRNPDAFGMHTYNDHMAYGAAEVVENMLIDFNDLNKNKDWGEGWAVAEGMVLFMLFGQGDTLYISDDGDGVNKICSQVVRMFLTALHMLELAEKLTSDSEVKNISWIMSLYSEMVQET